MSDGYCAGSELSIIIERFAGATVRIRVTGEVDLATAPRLRSALLGVVGGTTPPAEVAIELAGVGFIDAVGIGGLIAGRNAARHAGVGFSVRNPQGLVVRIIDLLGLGEVLRVTPPPAVTRDRGREFDARQRHH